MHSLGRKGLEPSTLAAWTEPFKSVSTGGKSRRRGGEGARWEGARGDVAMAAAATTVYLTALLNLIQPITSGDQLQ